MRILVGLLVVASAAVAAHADPCTDLDADQATWAKKLLGPGATFAPFCESCGDTAPGAAQKVASVTATKERGAQHLHVNGKVVDLATTYVQTGKATWANVGALVGCPAPGGTAIYAGAAAGGKGQLVELPPELGTCATYVHSIIALGKCDKIPAASRDAMRQAVDGMRPMFENWKTMDPQSRSAMLTACKQANDAVVQSMSAIGCKP